MKGTASILATHTPALFRSAVKRAATLLRAGELAALPTETVYGLAANALDARAVERIFLAKGRPLYNPIIVHVASLEMARACASTWPAAAEKLARAFWPGPLTLVLPRSKVIPEIVSASGPTVGVRWPRHPFIQAVIQACGFPLAAPSANLSNQVSPTSVEHVKRALGKRLRLIVDGGPAQVGIESTVLDLSVTPPRVLRPGMVGRQAIEAVVGKLQSTPNDETSAIRKSPGRLPKHYAPEARLVVWSWRDEADLRSQCSKARYALAKVRVIAHTHSPAPAGFGGVILLPREAAAFARAIYSTLHECDRAGAQLIVIEALPNSPEWEAIADRLRRAGGLQPRGQPGSSAE